MRTSTAKAVQLVLLILLALLVLTPLLWLVSTSLEGPAEDIFSSCLLYTSPSPRDLSTSRMPSSA